MQIALLLDVERYISALEVKATLQADRNLLRIEYFRGIPQLFQAPTRKLN
jgi:hypothetical protein